MERLSTTEPYFSHRRKQCLVSRTSYFKGRFYYWYIVLINYFYILFNFQETSIHKCSSKFENNALVTEGKKQFLKWSQKEQNLTQDIFSCKCRMEIKLSTFNHLYINQNFWLSSPAGEFYIFYDNFIDQNSLGRIVYGHYTPSMIASEVVLRTSSKKSKIKLIPQG